MSISGHVGITLFFEVLGKPLKLAIFKFFLQHKKRKIGLIWVLSFQKNIQTKNILLNKLTKDVFTSVVCDSKPVARIDHVLYFSTL